MDSGVLCIDLGTSSIRAAAHLQGYTEPLALELGEAFRSSIDRASIPSAVFVSSNASTVYFGEQALVRGLSGAKATLFTTSPKSWMTTGSAEELDDEVIPGTGVTRRHLLAGLMAQAFSAARKALPKSGAS